jgi:predicted DNA-binding transcriptional regulator YafY
MRASRLLSILLLLQLRGHLTAEELAVEFEVSVRTIYRDIEQLSAAGVPVYGDRGPGGGFQLLDGYRTHLTGFASDEAAAMFMIGMPVAAAALGLGSAAASAERKLLASLPPALSDGAGRMSARFLLDPVEWYHATEPVDHLPALARAILDQYAVTMTYESWTGTREWHIEPLGLVLKAGAWYAVANTQLGTRTFKVANIRKQVVEAVAFDRPADFDLPSHWAEQLKRFESTLRPHTALLRASAEGCKRLAKLGAYAAQAVSEADAPDPTGWACLRFAFENTEQAALLLLGIGPEVEVFEPCALRDRLRELAQLIAGLAA